MTDPAFRFALLNDLFMAYIATRYGDLRIFTIIYC
jgi:hypothetical protein